MFWFNIILLLVSALLTTAILVQGRSAGVSAAFGGGAEGFHIRRGGEKRVFQATILLALLFLSLSLAHLFF
jgi:preprotein translocase subunit SecG